MEHNMTFEEFWEQEERKGLLHRMRDDYPVWQRRRHIRRWAICSTLVVLAGIFTTFHFSLSTTHSYDYVCCNRNTFPDRHWVNVASDILTIETL